MSKETTSAPNINKFADTTGDNLTTTELLAMLTQFQSGVIWQLTRNGRIRGCLRNDRDQRVFDPITAVAFFRTGDFFPEGHWAEAAAAIGLEYSVCAEIVAASADPYRLR